MWFTPKERLKKKVPPKTTRATAAAANGQRLLPPEISFKPEGSL